MSPLQLYPELEDELLTRAHTALAIQDLLKYVGEDPGRDGLRETPHRVLSAFKFWCSGYNEDPKNILKQFENGSTKYDEMVFQGSIPFFSMCEHHLVPFFGYAHLAYIPKDKIVGLSKLARLVEIFARRLQIQERMSAQIVDALVEHLGCSAAVVTQARHLCMESRGVQKTGTITVCSALRGMFKDKPEVRAEFMALVQTAMGGIKIL